MTWGGVTARKRSARDAAKAKGHRLGAWRRFNHWPYTDWVTDCQSCGCQVIVRASMALSFDGPAVERDCPGDRRDPIGDSHGQEGWGYLR